MLWVILQVGHADTHMTMDVYAQLQQRTERQHGEAFDRLAGTRASGSTARWRTRMTRMTIRGSPAFRIMLTNGGKIGTRLSSVAASTTDRRTLRGSP